MKGAAGRPVAVLLAALALSLPSLHLGADEPLGPFPSGLFAEGIRGLRVDHINDSVALGREIGEKDDYRSFGFRLQAWSGRLGLLLALDSCTFRGSFPEPALRSDELVLGAALGPSRLEFPFLSLGLLGGGGLRFWGDFGQADIQELWHGVLGIGREFPKTYLASAGPLGFTWASAEGRLGHRGGGAYAEAGLIALGLAGSVLPSPGLETSILFRLGFEGSDSTNYVYIRHEGRLGGRTMGEALLDRVEAGFWAGWGGSTGLLRFENALSLEAPFATTLISVGTPLYEGPSRPGRRRGPRAELALATSLLEPGFSAARFLVLGALTEYHLGLEQRAGSTRRGLIGAEECHYQEGNLLLEAFFAPREGARILVPFAGLALGLRGEGWYDRSVNQITTLGTSAEAVARLSLGLRLDSALLGPPRGLHLALDLLAGWLFTGKAFPPSQPQVYLRASVLEG